MARLSRETIRERVLEVLALAVMAEDLGQGDRWRDLETIATGVGRGQYVPVIVVEKELARLHYAGRVDYDRNGRYALPLAAMEARRG